MMSSSCERKTTRATLGIKNHTMNTSNNEESRLSSIVRAGLNLIKGWSRSRLGVRGGGNSIPIGFRQLLNQREWQKPLLLFFQTLKSIQMRRQLQMFQGQVLSESSFPHLEAAFRISVVDSSTAEKGAPAE